MKEYIHILKRSGMFSGATEDEIESMLGCLAATTSHYDKNKFIIRSGEPIHSVGMVLQGSVLIVKEDFWGNRTIISEISAGSVFAEAYACLSQLPLETSVIANENCVVMFFDVKKILSVCSNACSHHTRLIQNLLSTLAEKNITLTRKIEHISKKTIRDKLLSYLSSESLKNNNASFSIPYNRQQLAEYLSVDRSALSNEISKLQSEGILTCHKNEFTMMTDYDSF